MPDQLLKIHFNTAYERLMAFTKRFPENLKLILLILALASIRLFLFGLVNEHLHSLPAALCQFDCGWYVKTARLGYALHPPANNPFMPQANWAFLPVFPLFIKLAVDVLRISYISSGFISANVSLCVFAFFAAKYLKLISENISTVALTIFLMAFPYGFYYAVQYTESIYAALTMIAFYLLARGKILSSSVTAGLLSVTRVTGVLFTPIIVFYYARMIYAALRKGQKTAAVQILISSVLPIAIAPLGLFCYMLYLYLHMGDAFAFIHVQRAWQRPLLNPLTTFINGLFVFDLDKTFSLQYASATFYALCVVFGFVICLRLLMIRRYAEFWFLFMSILLPLSAGLVGMQRYVLANPIFLIFLFDYIWRSKYRQFFKEIIFICVLAQLYIIHLWMRGYVSLI